jgi:membrane-bound metal-dependent hydrolase YbcI (DUF457 family)
MPSPVAHSAVALAGFLCLERSLPSLSRRRKGLLLAAGVLLATVPDIDFVPGFLLGDPVRFHRGITHSLTLCLALGLLAYGMLRSILPPASRSSVLAFLLLCPDSHPLLDYAATDASAPYGVPLFWPFSFRHFVSPISLFPKIHRDDASVEGFVQTLCTFVNARALFAEALFGGAIVLAVLAFRQRAERAKPLLSLLASMACGLLYCLLQFR